jgi:hypothetical protein
MTAVYGDYFGQPHLSRCLGCFKEFSNQNIESLVGHNGQAPKDPDLFNECVLHKECLRELVQKQFFKCPVCEVKTDASLVFSWQERAVNLLKLTAQDAGLGTTAPALIIVLSMALFKTSILQELEKALSKATTKQEVTITLASKLTVPTILLALSIFLILLRLKELAEEEKEAISTAVGTVLAEVGAEAIEAGTNVGTEAIELGAQNAARQTRRAASGAIHPINVESRRREFEQIRVEIGTRSSEPEITKFVEPSKIESVLGETGLEEIARETTKLKNAEMLAIEGRVEIGVQEAIERVAKIAILEGVVVMLTGAAAIGAATIVEEPMKIVLLGIGMPLVLIGYGTMLEGALKSGSRTLAVLAGIPTLALPLVSDIINKAIGLRTSSVAEDLTGSIGVAAIAGIIAGLLARNGYIERIFSSS